MQIYLVGGAIRDRLLSLPVQDRDWVIVGASPEEMLNQGYKVAGKDFPVFLHPTTHEEYALARTERKTGSGHQGFEIFSDPNITIEDDLHRRDLTINAIAEDEHGNLIDPHGGQKDLQDRILRHVSPAFSEDPLRVLRVARFAARFWDLGFTIAPETLDLMSEISDGNELNTLSKERIWQETNLALESARPEIYILILFQIGALQKLIPDLASALINKDSLLLLPKIRELNDVDFRYSALAMLASRQEQKIEPSIVDKFNATLASPRAFQELAELTCRYFVESTQSLTLDSTDVYSILVSLDFLRRKQRARRVVSCMQSMHQFLHSQHCDDLSFLASLIDILSEIKLNEETLSTLKGKQIAEALHFLHCKVIEKYKAELYER